MTLDGSFSEERFRGKEGGSRVGVKNCFYGALAAAAASGCSRHTSRHPDHLPDSAMPLTLEELQDIKEARGRRCEGMPM